MNRLFLTFLCLVLPLALLLAQDGGGDALDWNIDDLFDEPLDDPVPAEDDEGGANGQKGGGILANGIRQRGFALDASFSAVGGYSPGWSEAPWYGDSGEREFSQIIGAELYAHFGVDFQLSEALRVKNSFKFSVPGFSFQLEEFFFDYNVKNRVFLRAGQYGMNWGISSNYPFANLLSRVPDTSRDDPDKNWYPSSGGDSYIVKADIPIYIGGLQLLAMTRTHFIENPYSPKPKEIAYGGKYNLAFRRADIDMGILYHKEMPLRSFVSVKSTLFKNTEVYTEGMLSVRHETWDNVLFSWNAGFARDFFDTLFSVNGEVFYNGETGMSYFRPEKDAQDEEVSPFIDGFNGALNVVIRPGLPGDLRFFAGCLYSFKENAAQFVPGFRFNPAEHVTVSMAVPMVLGSRESIYYRANADENNRPFSVVLALTISGSYRFGYYK